MNEQAPPPRRRRLGVGSMEEFTEGRGALPQVDVGASMPAAVNLLPARATLDDSLDPSGRPYRSQSLDGSRQADPRLEGGWGRIVRTVFQLDEDDAFRRVSSVQFAKKPSRMEYGELIDELDNCSGLVVLAGQLYENAKVVLRLYELDVETLRAPMRKEAKRLLLEEKQASGGKMITNADVDSKLVELWPDEWRRQEENLAKAKGMASQCGNFHDRWTQRAREIDGMVRTVRKA